MKPLYERYVELKNKKAVLNGFTDYGDQWRQKYDTTTFEEEILDMYKPMQSFYEQLHAYVRRKLYEVYGEEVHFIICSVACQQFSFHKFSNNSNWQHC